MIAMEGKAKRIADLRDSLLCGECGAFRIATTDGRGCVCPNNHGKVWCVKPEEYKEAEKLNRKLPWLAQFPPADESDPGWLIGGRHYDKGRKLPDLHTPDAGTTCARIEDHIYEFTPVLSDRLATDGRKPLAKIGGKFKWRGNALPEGFDYICDGHLLLDKTDIAQEKAIKQIEAAGRHHKSVDAELANKWVERSMKPGESCTLLGFSEDEIGFRTLWVQRGDDVIHLFDADIAAWTRRALKNVTDYKLRPAGDGTRLQFLCGEKVSAALMQCGG
jgi:hypothetical protein